MTVPPAQRRALEIIRDRSEEINFAKQFAKLMWPDSPAWNRPKKCGYGSHRGGGMYSAGGGYLGKLEKMGLVRVGYREGLNQFARRWTITEEGLRILEGEKR